MLEVENLWLKFPTRMTSGFCKISLLLLGLCRTRHCVIDDFCQENPNDPVVLHNLGVALTEEGDGNWQRLL